MSERPATWLSRRERGTILGIRAAFRCATLFGRPATKPLVGFLAFWYQLFDRRTARISRAWLRRATGSEPGFFGVWRHLFTFAQTTLDKVFLLTGRTKSLVFHRTGHELLTAQRATGRGAVLLGAHVGSYEAMRAGGDRDDVPIKILGYFQNAARINSLLAELNPTQAAQVIHVGDDPVGLVAKVQECIEKGEFIAVLGDRTGLNDRSVPATFFGEPANFASGPFLLASILRCPVYLVFGLYQAPNRYELHCERFADRLDIPRRDRETALRGWVQRYAERVEHHARSAPLNWFNFYDFWAPDARGAAAARPAGAAPTEQRAPS
ncbi:MAG: lipid A biosynthesis acyltransferase [Planctomycetes bacterium]|nr:lipid A biosynthesis acyltransferase [Planctomycetota bacterium]